MIRDWELWPARIAAAAPEPTALPLFSIERGVKEVQHAIGMALYPTIRQLAKDLSKVVAA
jgi:gamma-glutamyl-gamma-aminobutyrate hydrolase PuuD